MRVSRAQCVSAADAADELDHCLPDTMNITEHPVSGDWDELADNTHSLGVALICVGGGIIGMVGSMFCIMILAICNAEPGGCFLTNLALIYTVSTGAACCCFVPMIIFFIMAVISFFE